MRDTVIRVGEWCRSALGREPAPAHPLAPAVRVELDRVRTLRFTMLEAARFRERTGLSFFKGGLSLMDLDESQFLALLVVCAEHEDPAVTADTLAPCLHSERLTDAVAALSILLSEFMPPVPEGSEDDPLVVAARSRLASMNSGRSPSRPSESRTSNTGA